MVKLGKDHFKYLCTNHINIEAHFLLKISLNLHFSNTEISVVLKARVTGGRSLPVLLASTLMLIYEICLNRQAAKPKPNPIFLSQFTTKH